MKSCSFGIGEWGAPLCSHCPPRRAQKQPGSVSVRAMWSRGRTMESEKLKVQFECFVSQKDPFIPNVFFFSCSVGSELVL